MCLHAKLIFPGGCLLQYGFKDNFSHPKGAWQVSQMSFGGIATLFFGLLAGFQSQSCPLFFRTSYPLREEGGAGGKRDQQNNLLKTQIHSSK